MAAGTVAKNSSPRTCLPAPATPVTTRPSSSAVSPTCPVARGCSDGTAPPGCSSAPPSPPTKTPPCCEAGAVPKTPPHPPAGHSGGSERPGPSPTELRTTRERAAWDASAAGAPEGGAVTWLRAGPSQREACSPDAYADPEALFGRYLPCPLAQLPCCPARLLTPLLGHGPVHAQGGQQTLAPAPML